MKSVKEGQVWWGKISYHNTEEEIEDPADVEKKIREGLSYVTNDIHLTTDLFRIDVTMFYFLFIINAAQEEMAGAGVGISDDLISLEITSPDVPDLTLIDLPGITRVAVKGQPENIGDQVRRVQALKLG